MRICAFVLIALVAIAAAQFDTLTQDQINKIDDCMVKVDAPCQIYTEDCISELQQADQCFDQCSQTDIHNMTVCTQGCKSNYNDVQAHIEQKTACMSFLEKNPSNNNENKIPNEKNPSNNNENKIPSEKNSSNNNENEIPSMNTGINILAFTVIASVLSLLL